MTLPSIETRRLRLRAFRPEDFVGFAAMWADPQVVRYIGARPRSRAESWASFLRYAGYWPLYGYGFWALEPLQRPGFWLGCIGFMHAQRGFADLDGSPECGWVLARDGQGQGLALEAALAAHRWYDHQRLGPSFVMIEAGHGASITVAARCDYRALRQDYYGGDPMRLMQRAPSAGPGPRTLSGPL